MRVGAVWRRRARANPGAMPKREDGHIEESAGKLTVPKSAEGKKTSAKNSTKHGCRSNGCRSRRLFVGDERQEDFDELEAAWRKEYEGEGRMKESLLGCCRTSVQFPGGANVSEFGIRKL